MDGVLQLPLSARGAFVAITLRRDELRERIRRLIAKPDEHQWTAFCRFRFPHDGA
jgi:hypothetical protein